MSYPEIRLGLCCINMTLRHKNYIYSSRRLNLSTLINKGLEVGEQAAKKNIIDLMKMMMWNKEHGIYVMRISSELVPHGTNNELVNKYGKKGQEYISLKFLEPYLKMCGDLAKLEGIRCTFHPAQFVQLGSPTPKVVKNSIEELKMHTTFLDKMGVDENSVIVIHVGGTYCDKPSAIKRFIETFNSMDPAIQNRIVVENDEKCYDAEDVLYICQQINRPMVFDYHHYISYPNYNKDIKRRDIDEIIPEILNTWTKLNIRPKFHLSEQMIGKPIGTHSLFIKSIPSLLLDIPKTYGINIDIMIEAKGKEIAISKLYSTYPKLIPPNSIPLPKSIPKEALKDLKIPQEIKESVDCDCSKSPVMTRQNKYNYEYQQAKSKYIKLKETN